MKPYSRNQKPFVYAAFSDCDRERALPILEKINEHGIAFWFSDRFTKKEAGRMEAACSCIVFISNDTINDEKVLRCIKAAEKYNKKILCIYLEPTELPPGMALHLNALQSIDRGSFNDEQAFAEKLKSAEIFKDMKITPAQKRSARRRAMASIIAPIASAVVIFFALVYPLAILPAMQAANGCLTKLGFGNLSLEELAKIEALNVIGTKTFDKAYAAAYTGSQTEVYVYELGITMPKGDIRDISDLVLLKNAKAIAFEANEVTDISPLYSIKSLENLTLNCNPVTSIEGIEALQNLRDITLDFTDVSDLSPLFKIPTLQKISFEKTDVSSIEGIEKLKHLTMLRAGLSNLTDISPLGRIDFSYINGTNGFYFEAKNLRIKDFSPLKGIPKFEEIVVAIEPLNLSSILPYISSKPVSRLHLAHSDIHEVSQLSTIEGIRVLDLYNSQQLSSIDGIQDHADINEVGLFNCLKLTDLTPLLKLPNLEKLTISRNMENLASSQLAGAAFKIDYQD
jgi:hypothetical protein